MPDLSLLSPEDLNALASQDFGSMSAEGRQLAFQDIQALPIEPEVTPEAGALKRFQYGFAKTKSDAGLLYRTLQVKAGLGEFQFGRNGIEYKTAEESFGSGFANASDEMKAAVLEELDRKELAQNFPNMNPDEIGGVAGFLGSLGGALISPTTLIPVGVGAKAGVKSLALIGGAFGFEYNVLDQLASTAKVDPKQAAVATGVSAIATPLTIKGLSALGTGVSNALLGKASPKKITEADKIMYEVQDIINEARIDLPDVRVGAQNIDEVMPLINKKTGLTKDQLTEYMVQATFKPKMPGSKVQALSAMADQQSALNPVTGGLLQGLRDFAGVISTDLSRISPRLGGLLERHDGTVANNIAKKLKEASPFFNLVNKLPDKMVNQLNRHLAAGEFDAAKSMLSKYDPNADKIFGSVEGMLTTLRDEMLEAGIKVGNLKNYFPLKVIDYKDLLKATNREDKPKITRMLEAHAKKHGYKSTDDMPIDEVEDVIAKFNGLRSQKAGATRSISTKGRQYQNIDENLIQQYKKPQAALHDYIEETVAAIEKRKFFGKLNTVNKGSRNISAEDSASKIVAQELQSKRIAPEDVAKATEIIEARFGMAEKSAGKASNISKNLIYQMTIANPLSAITQIADVGMSVFAFGLMPTIKALVGKKNFKLEQLNLDQVVSAEMGTVGAMARALDTAFKVSGFKFVDRLGKETIVNAAYHKFRKLANNKSGVNYLRKRFGNVFGDEFDSVLTDLRAGNITDNLNIMMFSELANFQPISLSQMPLKYLQHPNGRVFYALKSFTVKQLDVMRREILHEFSDGNPALGAKKLIAFATIIPLAGGSVQEVKDWLTRGDEIALEDIPDQFITSLFKVMGTSRYVVENHLAEGRITPALGEVFMPPISLFDGLTEDVYALSQGELDAQGSKMLSRVPVFGRIMQDWLLGAREEKRIKDILAD